MMQLAVRTSIKLPAAEACVAAPLRMAEMSAFSAPPSRVKNLKPLRWNGRWLAVIMIAPSYWCPAAGLHLMLLRIRVSQNHVGSMLQQSRSAVHLGRSVGTFIWVSWV